MLYSVRTAARSHFIVGRDHAGAGDYYGAFEAQEIFDTIPENALEIGIFRGDFTVWCKKCNADRDDAGLPARMVTIISTISGTRTT